MDEAATFTAFSGHRQIASGPLASVAAAAALTPATEPVMILENATGRPVELDLRDGPEKAVQAYQTRTSRPDPQLRQGRGRPRLGVVAREITLLPRHWDWLGAQPGGASATLRRLVEDARRAGAGPERARQAQEALYRAMSVLGGDLPDYEEATRALFARDDARVDALVATWPQDVAAYLAQLAKVERDLRPAP